MEQENDKQSKYDALSTFCRYYDPADETTATDLFSTKEIQRIVFDHTGNRIDLNEIYTLLIQMKYSYQLDDKEMKWLVRKT